ncbi:MAG: metallophosphoesterase [Acidimicrobiales bacterium]
MNAAAADGFDVIGDIHGHHGELVALLARLGYTDDAGHWSHPTRRAIFVGDLIDRGTDQIDVLQTVRAMVDSGAALAIAGNHEFNAVAFHTPRPGGGFCRPHIKKNRDQHEAFLAAVGLSSAEHDEWIGWFQTLPLWLELDGLRVVHAAWDQHAIDVLRDSATLGAGNTLTPELVVKATEGRADDGSRTPEWRAIEHLLKGPEVPIDPAYEDKGGKERKRARFQWWRPDADTLRRGALIPSGTKTVDGGDYPPLPDDPIDPPMRPYTDAVPVIYGHYWETGVPELTSPKTACVDYSAGNGEALVAYRWSGETHLDSDNFESSRSPI